MSPIWQSLLVNLALVSILLVAGDLAWDFTGRLSKLARSLLLGLLMCAAAIISMASADQILEGFFFDLRAPLVAVAAFFGGLPAMLVAAGGAVVYRAYLGGHLVFGIGGTLMAAFVGLLWHRIVQRRQRTLLDIFGLGLSVALTTFVSVLAVPGDLRMVIFQMSTIPHTFLSCVSTIIMGVLIDRQMRRHELSMTNSIYRAMVRELPDCLNIKDIDGRFLAANPATSDLMRAGSVDNLIGKTDFDFYPPDTARKFRNDELAALESGSTLRFDQPMRFPDGRDGWLSTAKTPFKDDKGRVVGLITYNRDVTEQKRVSQLKDEFISTVSHELRTPLTSIRGSLGLISAGVAGELPAKAANLVKIAHTNSERLVHLINDILDLEKMGSGKMIFHTKRMPVRPLLEQAIAASSSYMADKNIRIVLLDDAARAEAEIDADRLHQVMANLLSNAIKFSPAGETVAVRLARHAGQKLRLSVSDRGQGIPEEFRHRIFGKFEQADASSTRAMGGTGLGLNIVKMIAEKLGGSVSFETEEGKGTSFHVDLPEAVAGGAVADDIAGLEPVSGNRLRVLICEDEPDVASTIAAMLDAEGFSSDVAPDIASARALLAGRTYEALTLDIRLAGESGIELFRNVRASQENADIPVIVISAVADEARRSLNGAAVGIIDWLEKPVDPERLHAALGKVVGARSGHPKILHVEDDEGVLAVMSEGLGPDVSIMSAKTLHEAREAVASHRFDLVILDIALPDGSGLDLLADLPAETAVIVFSAIEFDRSLGHRVRAVMTKTKASELDVAQLVKTFLPAAAAARRP